MIHGLALLTLLLVMSTQLYAANAIDILTPEPGVRLFDETVWLVASTTAGQKDMIALVKNKSGVKEVKGKVLKKDKAFAFHALINLEDGLNEVTVAEKSLSVLYMSKQRQAGKSTEKEEAFQEYLPYFFHMPQKETRCAECHAMDAIKKGPKPNCSECHREITAVEYLHGPLGEGACFACHDPDSIPVSFATFTPGLGGEAELCFSCHKERGIKEVGKKFLHGPVEKGKCTVCHDPHGSAFRFQLPVEGKRVCYVCHEEKEKAAGKIVHKPILSKGCTFCHEPHSSDNRGHLWEVEQSLCSKAECHPEFAKITEHHPIRNHPVSGKFGPERNLTCSGCHNPHSSDFPSLLPKERSSLCSKCHEDIRFFRSSDRGLPWNPSQNGSRRPGRR